MVPNPSMVIIPSPRHHITFTSPSPQTLDTAIACSMLMQGMALITN
jgi:hypothetical protein